MANFKDSGFITLVADMLEMNLKALSRTEKHVADHICESTNKIEKASCDTRKALSEIKEGLKNEIPVKRESRGPVLHTSKRVRTKVAAAPVVEAAEELVSRPPPPPVRKRKVTSSFKVNKRHSNIADSRRIMFDDKTMMTIKRVDLSSLSRPERLTLQERLSDAVCKIRTLLPDHLTQYSIQKYLFSEQRTNCINIYLEEVPKTKITVTNMMDVKRVSKAILHSLQYLHRQGIPHGFVLLRYMTLVKEPEFKVMLPPPLIDAAVRCDSFWARHTCYCTPQEQLARSKKPPSLKSDVWQFGCLLLEMVTGERPWAHLSTHDSIMASGPVELLLPKTVSKCPELVSIFQRCLVRDEASRSSIDDLLALPFFAGVMSQPILGQTSDVVRPQSTSPVGFSLDSNRVKGTTLPRNVAVPRPLNAELINAVDPVGVGVPELIQKSPPGSTLSARRLHSSSDVDDGNKLQRTMSSPLRTGTPASTTRSPQLRSFDKNVNPAPTSLGSRKITSDVESLIERADRTDDLLSKFEKTLNQFSGSQAATNSFLMALVDQQQRQQNQIPGAGLQPPPGLFPAQPQPPTLIGHSQPYYDESQPFTVSC
eukprot:TRINITY_DN28715_c0_g1_i1.p1 TRINITY_DN28715_c0_g1~~TRINITY_DN28715_c0_g1_i1.p1  ORF type:complete len:607 (+),score=108.35 TRINITY_DN28715_c0_g1_i1:37-1821(+)